MNPVLENALGVAGAVLYFFAGWLYLAAGLVVPQPWHLLFVAAWLVGWWLVVRFWRERRAWMPLLAIGAFAVWAAFVQLGSWIFGWTA